MNDRDLKIEAIFAIAETADIIRLAAKIAVIADHIKAEGYCATADIIASAAKEIHTHAEKALNAATNLARLLEPEK